MSIGKFSPTLRAYFPEKAISVVVFYVPVKLSQAITMIMGDFGLHISFRHPTTK
jgi:hypothetical protein